MNPDLQGAFNLHMTLTYQKAFLMSMEERFDRAWVNFAWSGAVDSLVSKGSRWHSSHSGLVKTQDSIGDFLATVLRDAEKKARGDMELINWVWDLVKRLREYEDEPRLLAKLADTGRVMKVLEEAVKTSLDVLNIHDSESAECWRIELHREREVRLQMYEALVNELVSKRRSYPMKLGDKALMKMGLRRDWLGDLTKEIVDEKDQLEILTLLKYGLQEHGNVLLPREVDVISALHDWVVRCSGLVVGNVPEWFTKTVYDWEYAEKSFLGEGGEERCLRQAATWLELQHPHVRRFYGACHVGTEFIVHEHSERIDEKASWKILYGCALGLQYLHQRRFVHRRLTAEMLYTLSPQQRGLVSGMGLQRVAKVNATTLSFANDILMFGIAAFQLLARARGEHITASQRPPAVQPKFLSSSEWQLLLRMSSDVPEDNVSMLEIIQAMKGLAHDESSAGVAELEHTVFVDVDEVKSFMFPLAGQTIDEMLQDAEHLCNEISDFDDTNRQIYDRLEEVYEQLVVARTSFPEPLVGDFCSILWRFLQRLERGSAGGYSTTESLCASRTIANQNFGLHHDIDRLVLSSPCLHSTALIHQWQPQWREVQSEQQVALKACLERPIEYLNELPTENMREEALAVMQFEAGKPEIAGGVALPRWFIPPYQIEIEEHIAEGSFGSASKGRWLGAEVVIKQVLTDQAKRENREQFRQELDLWFALNHPNLIKLYGACHEGSRPFFVCELAPGGTLTSFVRGKDRNTVWRCLWYAAWGLGHLHERGIIHGDLKGNNILMGKDKYSVKLADFGLSVSAANSSLSNEYEATGALRWKAPECLLGSRPTFASDIYSFGMCIIEAITGDYPWGKSMRDEAVKYQVTEKQQLPKRPESFLDVEWGLIERMCCFNPDERISALALIQSAKRIQQWYLLGYFIEGEGEHYRRHQRLGLQFG